MTKPIERASLSKTRPRSQQRVVQRRVFKGWIEPDDTDELPERVEEVTRIKFGNTKWSNRDRKCTITVEWSEPKPLNDQAHAPGK